MQITTSHITSKGQVTIPVRLREELGLSSGDGVEFISGNNGQIIMKKSVVQEKFFGFFDDVDSETSVSLGELDEAIAGSVAELHHKSLGK